MAAFGNRAASYLVLERYEEAVSDCTAVLDMHLVALRTSAQGAQQEQAGSAAPPASFGEGGGATPQGANAGVGDVRDVPESSAAGPLHQWLQGLQGRWLFEPAQAAGLCKQLARRGAALAHLRRYGGSALDYGSAAVLAGMAGDAARQGTLEADAARVRALQSEGAAGGASGGTAPALP